MASKNFAISTVATAPSPATSGTTLVVASGEGARFPDVPFKATVWPTGAAPDLSNAEIVNVTDVTSDTLTIERESEGTTARTVVIGDQIAATLTAAMYDENSTDPATSNFSVFRLRFKGVGASDGNRVLLGIPATISDWGLTLPADPPSSPGQILADIDGAGSLGWVDQGASWGEIEGTLANQTDLQDALDALSNSIDTKVGGGPLIDSDLTATGPCLVGNRSAGSGGFDEIGLGNGLVFTGTDLDVVVVWGDVGGTLSDQGDLQSALDAKAPLASPALTGTPTVPTAAADTNTTQAASTAFVLGQAGGSNPVMNGTVAVGTSKKYSREDHVHASDTSRAPLASPTLTGTPAAPSAAADTNTTQIATTAYVIGQAGGSNPVMNGTVAVGTSKKYSREDHVHASDTSRAPLASPTFTGTPAAPTASGGTNTTQVATTAFVTAAVAAAPKVIQIACSDVSTAITAGTSKVTFRMPYAMTVTAVRASVNTAPTGSTIIIDINEGGTTILSTKLSIDASELTSVTAASAAVISDTSLADDAEITIDFDQVGSTIAGKGVVVSIIGY